MAPAEDNPVSQSDHPSGPLHSSEEKRAGSRRSAARELAHEALRRGEPLAWFETLYAQADDTAAIPWADGCVNPNLASWWERRGRAVASGRALVVGCGLGDDVQWLSELGWDAVGFDISKSAIQWCSRRFPNSSATYRVADLFDLPEAWSQAFDFVFEAYTLQVLPADLRPAASQAIAGCVASQGTLLVISRGRAPEDESGKMPWPLLREEFDEFKRWGMTEVQFEDYWDAEDPPVRRFRGEYQRSETEVFE